MAINIEPYKRARRAILETCDRKAFDEEEQRVAQAVRDLGLDVLRLSFALPSSSRDGEDEALITLDSSKASEGWRASFWTWTRSEQHADELRDPLVSLGLVATSTCEFAFYNPHGVDIVAIRRAEAAVDLVVTPAQRRAWRAYRYATDRDQPLSYYADEPVKQRLREAGEYDAAYALIHKLFSLGVF